MKQLDVNKVRRVLDDHKGSKVIVKANRGRHKYEITKGVISETYPSIFLIRLDDSENSSVQTVSYSYTDILTKDVRLALC